MSYYIELEVNGKLYISEYHVSNGVLTIYGNSHKHHKTVSEFTTVNNPDEYISIAKVLFRRLIKNGHVTPEQE
ncbi:hypothetical protein CDW43_15220 [Methylophaga nitratireducenticrescens]|nr:hypothetical protein CDW43_14925 [Methylophaga nitratireducenticrescens]AUZ85831.1 hypothetical protein CDW43_15220 [Methylophaga nitratireducenticrescens]